MTADEIAARFPKLYHVTSPDVVASIEHHGLLCAHALLALFEVPPARRQRLTQHRRPTHVSIHHPVHGRAVLNDNKPLSEAALAACLDDGLTPAQWLDTLNGKVFFWAKEADAMPLLRAGEREVGPRVVLVFDTATIAGAHIDTIAFSPINSGSTIRKPARRGHDTFAQMADRTYRDWQRMRGMTSADSVKEIVIDHAVPNAALALRDIRTPG